MSGNKFLKIKFQPRNILQVQMISAPPFHLLFEPSHSARFLMTLSAIRHRALGCPDDSELFLCQKYPLRSEDNEISRFREFLAESGTELEVNVPQKRRRCKTFQLDKQTNSQVFPIITIFS